MKPGVSHVRVLTVLVVLVLAGNGAGAQVESPRVSADAVVGAPSGSRLSGDTLETTTRDVASLLRCPVCQGLSVWDSPATMAVNMKHEVRELLAAGYGEDQILRYFEHSYGEFVRLAPSPSGIGLMVWVLPVVLMMAGAVIIRRMTSRAAVSAAESRRRPAELATTDLPGGSLLPEERDLAKYVHIVRELAHGKPGDH